MAEEKKLEKKVEVFSNLGTAYQFHSFAIDGRLHTYIKLHHLCKSGTAGPMCNAVGMYDGQLYFFKEDAKVELYKTPWDV